MGKPTPETGGGTPQNHGLSEFKPLSQERRVGWSIKKPEVPKQQPADPDRTLYERFHGVRRRSGVLGGHTWNLPENPIRAQQSLPQNPGEQRREVESSKPTPPEQQTPQRRKTQRELLRLALDPELRGLARELFGAIGDEGVTEVIEKAIGRYRRLPPDEALKRFNNDFRKGGFFFS
jgi:hypothetical protein